jgi:hypothetical protein
MNRGKRARINAVITRDCVRHSREIQRAENNENKLMARLILAIVCALSGVRGRGRREIESVSAGERKMSVIFMNEVNARNEIAEIVNKKI